ncbi:MAG: Rpp14/Pop5 family protein [archaeon]
MKPFLPSLREKKRYLVYEVEAEDKVDFKELTQEIQSSIKNFIGDFGLAQAGLIALPDWNNNRGIIKVNTKELDKIKTSLSLIKDVNGKPVIIKTIAVSGVIDKAKKELEKEEK